MQIYTTSSKVPGHVIHFDVTDVLVQINECEFCEEKDDGQNSGIFTSTKKV